VATSLRVNANLILLELYYGGAAPYSVA
jgi:hypothetical protein